MFAQQIAISFRVQVGDGTVDSGVEGVDIGKRLVGEIEGFEVMPDHAIKSALRLVREVATISFRCSQSSAPIMASRKRLRMSTLKLSNDRIRRSASNLCPNDGLSNAPLLGPIDAAG